MSGPSASGPEPLRVPQGTFLLRRHPERLREGLRAWDSADWLLLHRVAGVDPGVGASWVPVDGSSTTLVIGDAFGALSVGLAATGPDVLLDSYCSQVAVRENLRAAGVDPATVRVSAPTERAAGSVDFPQIDLLVVRPPRQTALLEHLLRVVAGRLHPGSVIVAADMVQHVHSSTIEVFERVIGPTTSTRARRRARVVESEWGPPGELDDWPWPRYGRGPRGLSVASWPGVFAAGRIDPATALLADAMPPVAPGARVVDLGCGNGVIGAMASIDGADVTFVDDSALALESARATLAASGGDVSSARFIHGNSLGDWNESDGSAIETASVDLIVTNPPFHEHRAMGDAVAWQMIVDSHRALRSGGEVLVVGNRHLAHHAKLRRIFGNCTVVASTPRYVVVRASRA